MDILESFFGGLFRGVCVGPFLGKAGKCFGGKTKQISKCNNTVYFYVFSVVMYFSGHLIKTKVVPDPQTECSQGKRVKYDKIQNVTKLCKFLNKMFQ